jgi:hypothetical protein
MTTTPDPIAAILAEIDRIEPLIAKLGTSAPAGGKVSAEDVAMAVEALKKLRAKLEALAAG